MPGIGEAIGFFFNLLGSKEERRRNAIEKLEKEQEDLLKKSPDYSATKRMQFVSGELAKLYKQAKNK